MRSATPARFAPAVPVAFVVLAALTACGGSAPDANSPASAKSGGGDGAGVKVGDKAPALALDSVNGQGKLAVTPGKVTIVDFWATWCEPCKKSFPKYQDLYTKHKASGLEIVAVSVDEEKGGIPDFIKTHGAKFPVGWDEGHKVADQWKPENMPTAYVVDKEGVVRHVHKGYHDGEEAELEKEVKALF